MTDGRDTSMEDILASIKRVIAEDQPSLARRGRTAPRADSDDVLELDQPMTEGESLLSDDAASASREKLARLSQLTPAAQAGPVPQGDGPLEAVVREMLRPMLKDWLDQRLPEIVEEVVAREVARITGRGR